MMNNVLFRKAHISDSPYLYEICLKTGFRGENAEPLFYDLYMLGQYYAVNYLYYESDSCFVIDAVDTNSVNKEFIPQGYIVGVQNSYDFEKWMQSYWLPILQKRYPVQYHGKTDFEKRIAGLFHQKFDDSKSELYKNYPAHLHIDILPTLQGYGYGKKLMALFIEEMRKKNCSGIHLGVGKQNRNAFGFYNTMGFKILSENELGYTLGYSL